MISANNVTYRVGKKALFEEVNIKFTEGNCYGLIGANGAGKSTFLKILSGQLETTNGDIVITPGQRLSVLEQDHFKYDAYNVLDVVIMGNQRLYDIMKEKDAIYAKDDFTDEDGIRASELVKVLDYLLPEGPLFRSKDYRGKVEVDESDADHLDIPMAVLVNGDSYSAAEFFAAALDEYDAAIVVGEKTTGKGYFQSSFELEDGSAVGLSIGKYTTPNGVSLADVGITPEVYVEVDEETAFQIYAATLDPEEDPQIQAAVKALKSK